MLHDVETLTLGQFLIGLGGNKILFMKIDIFLDKHCNILLKDFTNYIKPQNIYAHTDEVCALECVINPY